MLLDSFFFKKIYMKVPVYAVIIQEVSQEQGQNLSDFSFSPGLRTGMQSFARANSFNSQSEVGTTASRSWGKSGPQKEGYQTSYNRTFSSNHTSEL